MHRISRHQHNDGESDDALQQHEHAVDAGDQRQPPVRGILAGAAFRFLFDVGEYRLVGECVDVRGELLPAFAALTARSSCQSRVMYMPKATPNAISPTMSAVNSEKTITKIIQPTVHLNRGPGCMCFTVVIA